MKRLDLTSFLQTFCVLLGLLALTAAWAQEPNRSGAIPRELVGTWTVFTLVDRRDRDGRVSTTPYSAGRITRMFTADGRFITSNHVRREPVVLSGVYELQDEHTLRLRITQASGPDGDYSVNVGRVSLFWFMVDARSLITISEQRDRRGVRLGTVETRYERVEPTAK